MSFDQIRQKHSTSFDEKKPTLSIGLTEQQAADKLLVNGPNLLTPVKTKSSFQLYIHCLMNKFNLMLILCAVLTWIVLAIPGSYSISGVQFSILNSSFDIK